MFHAFDRFQAFCRGCYQVFEDDTIAAAIHAAEQHEESCPAITSPHKDRPLKLRMESSA